jgi:hypothetical protein
MKAASFTIAHQREDGAWHYSSHRDGYVNAVDNTHTGDNLEYLFLLRSSVAQFPHEDALKSGVDYYLNHFFLENGMPKFTDQLLYPVDIHSCAQSVITLASLARYEPRCREVAFRATDWILDNMRDPEGFFYYRLYDANSYDKSDFIGWGDAWMVKALALLIASTA